MWGNYLTLGLRSLMKNGTHAFTNIAGPPLAIAIGTVSSHALRVARTNPIHALRYE
jgi:putative ABC transport system permease protein